jgi:hypothetical protein
MKALVQLHPYYPQGFTTAGATLFFIGRLTASQVRAVFNKFPVIACVETDHGYYLREDIDECRHDPNCGAYKAMHAAREACAPTSIKPS